MASYKITAIQSFDLYSAEEMACIDAMFLIAFFDRQKNGPPAREDHSCIAIITTMPPVFCFP